MNIWVTITLLLAPVVFGLDFLIRRKKWKDNTKEEKVSLLVHMFSIGPHLFASAVGMVFGIAAGRPETAFGKILYQATLFLGFHYFVVALAAVISSLILRKIGKVKASLWVNVIAFAYIIVILTVNHFTGELL